MSLFSKFKQWNAKRKRSLIYKLKAAVKREMQYRKGAIQDLNEEQERRRRLESCIMDLRTRSEKYWLGYDPKTIKDVL